MKNSLIVLKQLDHQLASLKERGAYLRPKQGWVRTIRKAIGMTIKQLGKRLQVDPSRVVKIETAEILGAVTLRTMQETAEALGCTFVYSFMPKTSLEEMIRARAKDIAVVQVKRTAHSMDLEAQSLEKEWLDAQVKDTVDNLLHKSWKHLWE